MNFKNIKYNMVDNSEFLDILKFSHFSPNFNKLRTCLNENFWNKIFMCSQKI